MKKQLPVVSHYRDYNVLEEQDHWDPHTRSIVRRRLEPKRSFRFLTPEEGRRLAAIVGRLVDESREEIVQFVVEHMDRTLADSIGESERKKGLPPARELVRSGLSALEQATQARFGDSFPNLPLQEQIAMLKEISEGRGEPEHVWQSVPQSALFQKWLNLAVEAYYSHPYVWSEIGYGGPAYPRGYVRAEIGVLDPWEAQPTKTSKE
ncbi:gluconate 2-dehydrogenase subunit 3 family protein [Paenibacillus sp.]|uniref:gluconate 2-dehydrogenase subunit 3 family protein n=1 Tax=Paenibacillus sp. TaxID=58172 RepID=UPI002D459623|nr:gluconate 2-dehydrogenase subunit 3 family protein [Paenibacillus sp.]HZG87951.1 gluconate 2-dehydrogenase subunit 3 family protein [Paenibacillus sp.]